MQTPAPYGFPLSRERQARQLANTRERPRVSDEHRRAPSSCARSTPPARMTWAWFHRNAGAADGCERIHPRPGRAHAPFVAHARHAAARAQAPRADALHLPDRHALDGVRRLDERRRAQVEGERIEERRLPVEAARGAHATRRSGLDVVHALDVPPPARPVLGVKDGVPPRDRSAPRGASG